MVPPSPWEGPSGKEAGGAATCCCGPLPGTAAAAASAAAGFGRRPAHAGRHLGGGAAPCHAPGRGRVCGMPHRLVRATAPAPGPAAGSVGAGGIGVRFHASGRRPLHSFLILAFFLSFFSPLAPLPASQVKQPRPLVECVGGPASYPKTRQAGSVGCSRPGGAGACQGALVCAGRVERERAGLCAWPPLSVCSAGVAPRPPRLASQLPTRPRVELAVRHS